MNNSKSDKMLEREEIALHDLGEKLVIYADQIQEAAAENHRSTGAVLCPSNGFDEFFMLHSVEDGRLTGVYHFMNTPIFRADARTPAELSESLIGFVRGLYRLRRSLSSESVFDDKTYEQISDDLMEMFDLIRLNDK